MTIRHSNYSWVGQRTESPSGSAIPTFSGSCQTTLCKEEAQATADVGILDKTQSSGGTQVSSISVRGGGVGSWKTGGDGTKPGKG